MSGCFLTISSPSVVDMTTPGTKTITVSYPTANGNVFTATMTITVSERG